MATRIEYTTEQLEAIASKLKKMPPVEKSKQKHSKQSAVKFLAKEIELMQQRGYTLEAIVAALKGEGFDIASTTLKNYLQRSKSTTKTTKTTKTTTKVQRQKKPELTSKQTAPAAATSTADKTKASFTPTPDSDEI